MITKRLAALGFMFAAFAALTACGQDQTQTAGTAGEMYLIRGNGSEPESLDPNLVSAEWESSIVGDLMMGLLTDGQDGEPIPGAAERWETSEDGLTWTFHLRDHQWSDGQPVTAEDFVFSWRRVMDPQTAARSAYLLFPVKNAQAINGGQVPPTALGVSAPDAKTFVVELEYAVPFFTQLMRYTAAYPLPRHAVEMHGREWTRAGNYVGNGAYTLVAWTQNEKLVLRKNPRFYDAANVRIERVEFLPTQNYEAALQRFRAGELDTQIRIPGTQIDWVRANIPWAIDTKPVLTLEFYALNLKREPFDDIRVREALSLALDRDTLLTRVSRIGNPPAYSYVPPGIANYPGGAELDFKNMPFAQRLERARMLMREAGYGPDNPLRTTMSVRSAAPDARRVPAAIQDMWRQAYVEAEIVQMDGAVFYNNLQEHDFDIGLAGWVADYNDATTFLDMLRTGNANNWAQYSNPQYDAVLDQATRERDLTRRGELLAQAHAMVLKDHPWVPSFYGVNTNMVQQHVKGWVTNISNVNRTRWLWVERTAPARAAEARL
jgi:oligopeptide transport system substrate-binding protein